ncbi:hypothetical protein L1049_023024 [Liquidambar formosana]|uniref:DUF7750 domain-containing protein n=1 Tax=Liquidambar formosana TaxID=63359 RepID=A0AAP0WSN4_LIQFO
MSLTPKFSNTHLHSQFKTPNSILILHRNPFQLREFRVWRRRRLKINRKCAVRNQLGPLLPSSFEDLFQNLVSQFPSVNSLDLVAPALGFASGVALFLSRLRPDTNSELSDVGEWVLFTSPTPFNRFVLLRCPSISFEGSELLEDVNEKLVKKDRHFVRLNSGRIHVRDVHGREDDLMEKLAYQRECVITDDGGVISLDWPANLDLTEEHGLDTTLLLIPGTAQGSSDRRIRSFVFECLKRGFFPVVMNPRGCAGSPLTTARLFTAADSDDICTAIQFINKARPWTTLMGVGWGYGANMLTKYLAEVGEKTPLTAATCIDNPFDLEEATRSSPHQIAVDHKLTGGLIDILRSNKELFQGRTKGFDVEKALSAKSVRDLRKQYLCVIVSARSVISWCQDLTIEWLTAVELGLLKGRHPLLKDVDVTINPSKGLALVEGKASDKGGRVNKLLDLTLSNALKGYSVVPRNDMLEENDNVARIRLRSRRDTEKVLELEDKALQQVHNGALQQTSSVDAELIQEDGVNPVDNERGQVLQTAQVVMNMLDVTMPDTLTEEQKKKVLTAVGQGETIMKALQGAVPEDVREKLKNAVSGILQTQGTNLNLDGLLHIGQIANASSGLNINLHENVGGLSSEEGLYKDPHSSDQRKMADDLEDGLDTSQPAIDQPAEGLESDLSEKLQKSIALGQSHSTNNDHNENGSETGADSKFYSQSENASDTEEAIVEQDDGMAQLDTKEEKNASDTEEAIVEQDDGMAQLDTKEEKNIQKTEEEALQSSSEAQPEGNDDKKRDEKDALTGMDETTQVAVQSVFGVIEDMITHLEEEKYNDNEVNDGNEVKGEKVGSVSEKHIMNDPNLEKKEDNENDPNSHSDILHDTSAHDCENHMESHMEARSEWVEEKLSQNPISLYENGVDYSQGNNTTSHVDKRENERKEHLVGSKLLAKNSNKLRHVNNIPLYVSMNPYGDSLYNEYLRRYLLSKMPNTKSLDLDTTTALLLDYFPEDGEWKLLEQPGNSGESNDDTATCKGVDKRVQAHSPGKADDTDNIIEPPYVVLDTEKQQEPVGEYEIVDKINAKVEIEDDRLEELMHFVKNIILDSLKVEVGRKLGAADMKEMESNVARDMEQVANAVSLAVRHDKECIWSLEGKDNTIGQTSEKIGTLHGEHIIRAVSFAVQDTNYLRRVLPIGVIVGSSLAALRKFFNVATVHDSGKSRTMTLDQVKNSGQNNYGLIGEMKINQMPFDKTNPNSSLDTSKSRVREEGGLKNINNETVMVGAVTAALEVSGLLMHQQSKSFKEKGNHQEEPDKLEEAMSEKDQNNIVTSLAEKAMSVAGPVVPTKEDGEVDQDRLVAMLAEMGQKGGMLKLVGKVALLWGGLRGAMSLTERLISFLCLAERPLFQRILGFVCMVLVLWSPVVVPLLPTLMRSWATHNSSRIAELACIAGLYTAIVTLVMLWGKRVRGYESPFEQYGLDFTSSMKDKCACGCHLFKFRTVL